jgi:hypothetical protein
MTIGRTPYGIEMIDKDKQSIVGQIQKINNTIPENNDELR